MSTSRPWLCFKMRKSNSIFIQLQTALFSTLAVGDCWSWFLDSNCNAKENLSGCESTTDLIYQGNQIEWANAQTKINSHQVSALCDSWITFESLFTLEASLFWAVLLFASSSAFLRHVAVDVLRIDGWLNQLTLPSSPLSCGQLEKLSVSQNKGWLWKLFDRGGVAVLGRAALSSAGPSWNTLPSWSPWGSFSFR